MSYSSLWGITKKMTGAEFSTFHNSHLFAAQVEDLLFRKYIRERSMFPHDDVDYHLLNHMINDSPNHTDRIVWELACQQIFYTTDINTVVKHLDLFLEQFASEGNVALASRVVDMQIDLGKLSLTGKYPYFCFKRTSCDDDVENWFAHRSKRFKSGEPIVGLVILQDDKIKCFRNNVWMCDSLGKGK